MLILKKRVNYGKNFKRREKGKSQRSVEQSTSRGVTSHFSVHESV